MSADCPRCRGHIHGVVIAPSGERRCRRCGHRWGLAPAPTPLPAEFVAAAIEVDMSSGAMSALSVEPDNDNSHVNAGELDAGDLSGGGDFGGGGASGDW